MGIGFLFLNWELINLLIISDSFMKMDNNKVQSQLKCWQKDLNSSIEPLELTQIQTILLTVQILSVLGMEIVVTITTIGETIITTGETIIMAGYGDSVQMEEIKIDKLIKVLMNSFI